MLPTLESKVKMRVQIQKLDGAWLTVSTHVSLEDTQAEAKRWAALYPGLPVRLQGKVGTGILIETYTGYSGE